ncbi:unnamed protein product [Pocillopora meandrina]|uniref:Uncharacterized protein n=1 Tax=Pocillopora meandrina TaxID=46732 RepID=A0AAU9XA93_9CNID|nr:unnamed protein product [Pocillopora meandrina]
MNCVSLFSNYGTSLIQDILISYWCHCTLVPPLCVDFYKLNLTPWKITPVPWGTFRTPHLERLKAGNAIMSMMQFLLKLANEVCHLDLSSTGD